MGKDPKKKFKLDPGYSQAFVAVTKSRTFKLLKSHKKKSKYHWRSTKNYQSLQVGFLSGQLKAFLNSLELARVSCDSGQ